MTCWATRWPAPCCRRGWDNFSGGEIHEGPRAHSVSIMEFAGGFVAHETQYFADPFDAPQWRAALAEPMPDRPG